MSLVKNKCVKMDWEASSFVTLTKGTFIVAGKDYESTKFGTITVFFNCETAFLFISDADTDDQDFWDGVSLKQWLKTNLDGSFPISYDEYVPIVEWGADTINDGVLEKYGLEAYADDIKARLEDLQGFNIESDTVIPD